MLRALALAGALLVGLSAADAQQFPSGYIQGNAAATAAPPRAVSPSSWLDRWCGSSQWMVVVRGASAWQCVSNSGTGSVVFSTSPALVTPNLGVPSAVTLTNGTDLPVSTGISGLASGIASWLATSSSANLATALTDETGTGAAVFANSPALVTPDLGTPSALVLTNASGLPVAGISGFGTGVATALGTNVGSAGAPVVNGGALGTPSSGTLTNATGLPVLGISGLASGIAAWLATSSSANLASALTDETGSGASVFANSPALTGTPTAPTPSASDNSTKIATTAYVDAQVAGGVSGVASLNGQTGALTAYFPPQGRLTLVTATPVMTTTQSAKTTIYYTPYVGNMVPIYDGSNMVPTAVAEISVATTDTAKNPAAIGASKVNDWFVWNDAGTIRLSHGPDWTNDTTRSAGTALVMVNGILLNNASITNGPAASRGTYVGTTRSNASSQLDWIYGGSATAGFLGVCNYYNRVSVISEAYESTANWTYTSGTWRTPNGGTASRNSFVSCAAEDAPEATYMVGVAVPNVLYSALYIGLHLDANSGTPSKINYTQNPAAANFYLTMLINMQSAPLLGFHYFQAMEASDGTNSATYYGTSKQSLLLRFRM